MRSIFAVVAATGVLGLCSGTWIYVTYNAGTRTPLVSFSDALGSGVLDWGLWVPFLPLSAWITRRLRPGQGRTVRTLAGYGLAAALLSLAQLTLFALASVGLRAMLYEQDPRLTPAEIVRDAMGSAFDAKFKSGLLLCLCLFAGLNAREAWRRLRDRPSRSPRRSEPPPLPLQGEGPGQGRWIASAGGKVALLRFEEIDWVEAAGNYLRIYSLGRMHLDRGTLRGFFGRARDHGFVRVHRSALVRTGCIAGISTARSGDLELELRDGSRLRASRRYRASLVDALGDRAVRPARSAAHPSSRSDASARM